MNCQGGVNPSTEREMGRWGELRQKAKVKRQKKKDLPKAKGKSKKGKKRRTYFPVFTIIFAMMFAISRASAERAFISDIVTESST